MNSADKPQTTERNSLLASSQRHGLTTPSSKFPSSSRPSFQRGETGQYTSFGQAPVTPDDQAAAHKGAWLSFSSNGPVSELPPPATWSKRDNGLPKISRECLWGEIKCYGKWILACWLIFVGAAVLAVVILKQRR